MVGYKFFTQLNVVMLGIFIPNRDEVEHLLCLIRENIHSGFLKVWAACSLVNRHNTVGLGMRVTSDCAFRVL